MNLPQKNRTTWQEFEELVEKVHRAFHPKATVKRDDKIVGKVSKIKRQIDISIRYKLGPTDILIVVECRRHGRKIDVDAMNGYADKIKDVGANLGIMVAEKGFTRGAKNVAEHNGIKIYTLRDTRKKNWPDEITVMIFVEAATIRLTSLYFTDPEGKTIEFAKGQQSKLFDSANPKKEITLNDLVREVWKDSGKPAGKSGWKFDGHIVNEKTGAITHYHCYLGFDVEVRRFSREASLEMLGLVDSSDGTTHMDSFTMVTQPGKAAVFHSEPEFWKRMKAPFGVIMDSIHVVWPNEENDPETLANLRFTDLMHRLPIQIAAQAGDTPINLHLGA